MLVDCDPFNSSGAVHLEVPPARSDEDDILKTCDFDAVERPKSAKHARRVSVINTFTYKVSVRQKTLLMTKKHTAFRSPCIMAGWLLCKYSRPSAISVILNDDCHYFLSNLEIIIHTRETRFASEVRHRNCCKLPLSIHGDTSPILRSSSWT